MTKMLQHIQSYEIKESSYSRGTMPPSQKYIIVVYSLNINNKGCVVVSVN